MRVRPQLLKSSAASLCGIRGRTQQEATAATPSATVATAAAPTAVASTVAGPVATAVITAATAVAVGPWAVAEGALEDGAGRVSGGAGHAQGRGERHREADGSTLRCDCDAPEPAVLQPPRSALSALLKEYEAAVDHDLLLKAAAPISDGVKTEFEFESAVSKARGTDLGRSRTVSGKSADSGGGGTLHTGSTNGTSVHTSSHTSSHISGHTLGHTSGGSKGSGLSGQLARGLGGNRVSPEPQGSVQGHLS